MSDTLDNIQLENNIDPDEPVEGTLGDVARDDESDESLDDQNPVDESSQSAGEPKDDDSADDETQDAIIADFISLNLLREYLRIIGSADDLLLTQAVFGARAAFENYTQRPLSDFGGEIPADVINWGLAFCADFFENRGIYKKELFYLIDRYRKSPLRLDIDETCALKAELAAQRKMIEMLMAKSLERNTTQKGLDELESEPSEPRNEQIELSKPSGELENEQTSEAQNGDI